MADYREESDPLELNFEDVTFNDGGGEHPDVENTDNYDAGKPEEDDNHEEQKGVDHGVPPCLVPNTTLVLKNLIFTLPQDQLVKILNDISAKPTSVVYAYDADEHFSGMAFAQYRGLEDAIKAFEALDGLDIEGRRLKVEYKRKGKGGDKHKSSKKQFEVGDELYDQILAFKDSKFQTETTLKGLNPRQRRDVSAICDQLHLSVSMSFREQALILRKGRAIPGRGHRGEGQAKSYAGHRPHFFSPPDNSRAPNTGSWRDQCFDKEGNEKPPFSPQSHGNLFGSPPGRWRPSKHRSKDGKEPIGRWRSGSKETKQPLSSSPGQMPDRSGSGKVKGPDGGRGFGAGRGKMQSPPPQAPSPAKSQHVTPTRRPLPIIDPETQAPIDVPEQPAKAVPLVSSIPPQWVPGMETPPPGSTVMVPLVPGPNGVLVPLMPE